MAGDRMAELTDLERQVLAYVKRESVPITAHHVRNEGLTLTPDAGGRVLRQLAQHGAIRKVAERPDRYRPADGART